MCESTILSYYKLGTTHLTSGTTTSRNNTFACNTHTNRHSYGHKLGISCHLMGWAVVDSAIESNLFTIISNTHHSWHSHPLMCFKGVRGHVPSEKCQNLRLEMVLSGAYKSPN